MYKVINEYTAKVNLQANEEIYNRIIVFLKDIKDIKSVSVSESFNRYVLDIKLKNYSVEQATEVFNKINIGLSYAYSSMYVRFNEGKCVRYRFMTSKENKEALYCDIIFN